MRKICVITLLVCLTLLPLAGSAQTYISIAEMNEHPLERWIQAYETQWRTIEINVLPKIPQVNKFPVLKVMRDLRIPDISGLGDGWSGSVSELSGIFRADHGYIAKVEQDEKQFPNAKIISTNYYPPFDMGAIYGKNGYLTLGEMVNRLKYIMSVLSEDGEEWRYEQPEQVLVNSALDLETGEVLRPDNYYINLIQELHGIPLFSHVLFYAENTTIQEIALSPHILLFHLFTPENVAVSFRKLKVSEVLSDDVPLCDFEQIQETIEGEILAGHIRKIFDIELGYTLYNEPGITTRSNNRETLKYYAVPVWKVNCYYVESAKKEMRDYTGKDVPERGEIEYTSLIINAQTGELFDRFDKQNDRGDYQGFLSWDDVGGKP